MKKVLLSFLLLVQCFVASAQGVVSDDVVTSRAKLSLSRDLSQKESEFDLMEHGSLFMSCAYRNTKFLNNSYMGYLDSEFMTASAGITMSMEFFILLKHLSADVTFFGNGYKINHSSYEGTVRHAGTEFFLNGYILPDFNGFTYHFCPFVGAGYQFSRLREVSTDKDVPNINTSGLMLKAGTKLFYREQHYIYTQYKQSFPEQNERMFRSFEIGLGIVF